MKFKKISIILSIFLIGIVFAMNSVIASEGLIAHYNFDENSGNILTDISGNGYNGDINGATWVESIFGTGLNFNGNDYVNIGDPSGLEFGSSNYAITAWVKVTSSSWPGNPIIAKMDGWGGNDDWQVTVNDISGGDIIYQARHFSLLSLSTSGYDYRDSKWHHIVVTKTDDGSTGTKLYVDGILKDSGIGVNIEDGTTPIRIGANSEPYYFRGSIDEVRIYNRTLTNEEISELAQIPPEEKEYYTKEEVDGMLSGLEQKVDDLENRTSLLESIVNKIIEFIKNLPKGLSKAWIE